MNKYEHIQEDEDRPLCEQAFEIYGDWMSDFYEEHLLDCQLRANDLNEEI